MPAAARWTARPGVGACTRQVMQLSHPAARPTLSLSRGEKRQPRERAGTHSALESDIPFMPAPTVASTNPAIPTSVACWGIVQPRGWPPVRRGTGHGYRPAASVSLNPPWPQSTAEEAYPVNSAGPSARSWSAPADPLVRLQPKRNSIEGHQLGRRSGGIGNHSGRRPALESGHLARRQQSQSWFTSNFWLDSVENDTGQRLVDIGGQHEDHPFLALDDTIALCGAVKPHHEAVVRHKQPVGDVGRPLAHVQGLPQFLSGGLAYCKHERLLSLDNRAPKQFGAACTVHYGPGRTQ